MSKLLTLVADVSIHASFPEDEVHLQQQNRAESLRAERSQPSFLAREKFAQAVYGSSPYAHVAPTEDSIHKMDGKALAAFRDTYMVPNNAALIVIGKLPAHDAVMKLITAGFGAWGRKDLPAKRKNRFARA